MTFSSRIKPISYLKSEASDIVRDIAASDEPILITQDGEAKLVVMDVRSYEEHLETLALLKLLAIGQQEIARGEFRSAEDVFAELDHEN